MQEQIKIPKIQEIQKQWNSLSKIYEAMDSNPQTFYYILVNMLKFQSAKNILQVGCGCGRLLTYATSMKNPQAFYYATDLSQQMLNIAKIRLQQTLDHFQCHLSIQQWCQKKRLIIRKVDNQQKVQPNIKFDRIICNLVLMLTENPTKMLNSLNQQAEQGCLMGITIWGQKSRNNFHTVVAQVIEDLKLPVQKARSNFHLFKTIQKLVEQTGWQILLNWQQDVPMGYLQTKQVQQYFEYTISRNSQYSVQQKSEIKKQALRRVDETLKAKKVLNFPCQCLIVRKKK